ncbi:hypothetical protein R3P38DRAFT_3254085 [Favolaschia claudopus]|uniref:Transcription activator GCR1-like domain-containing protein n=1 Tax=Favolaschia claudopus TaxID=2862362 RepID=A0AAW0DN78_9AGAR
MARQAGGLHVIPYHGPPTPLESKRRRFRLAAIPPSTTTSTSTLPRLPPAPYRFDAMDHVVDVPTSSLSISPSPTPAPVASTSTAVPPSSSTMPLNTPPSATLASTTQASYDLLDARSHAIWNRLTEEKQEDKGTAPAYKRHYISYQTWWATDQARIQAENTQYVPIPALPITPAKVVVFLEYEMARPQKRKLPDGKDSTSTCGSSHGSQVINALEHYRLHNQHEYRDIADTQQILRSDPRVKAMEKGFQESEPERTKKSHALKAVGTNADTFQASDLSRMSIAKLFETKGGKSGIWRGHRDRGMTLTSCSAALRGDSTRAMLWSDLGSHDVPMVAKGPGCSVKALIFRADQSKSNKTGRVDEHGAFRHFDVTVCPVGAIAFFFYTHFHILKASVPDFAPDFDDDEFGEYGHRQWYDLHLFSSAMDCTKEMVYATHRYNVKNMFQAHNVNISKVTHAGRGYTAKTARENRASSTEVKALGCWNESGSYRPCYDHALPLEAVLAAGGFDGKRPESHFLARETLQPPDDVVEALFPFVEPELDMLATRRGNKRQAEDYALTDFLKMLIWFRTVLVQDAALLYVAHPEAELWNYPPFHSPSFRNFARTSATAIKRAEEDASLQLKNLPHQIAETFRGMVTQLHVEQQLNHEKNEARSARMYAMIQDTLALSRPSKRSKVQESDSVVPRAQSTSYNSLDVSAMSFDTSAICFGTPELSFDASAIPGLALGVSTTNVAVDASAMTVTNPPFPSFDSGDFDFNFDLPAPSTTPQLCEEQQTALSFLNSTLLPPSSSSALPLLPTTSSDIPQRPIPAPPPLAATPAIHSGSFLRRPPPLLRQRKSGSGGHEPDPKSPPLAMSREQEAEWCHLAQLYGEDRLRRHEWEASASSSKIGKQLIPYYTFQSVSTILDLWVEYSTGANGHLPIRTLDEVWGAHWRRGNRSEANTHCRRSKLWKLVQDLSAKRNWNTDLALRFIREKYQDAREPNGQARFSTSRSFCDWLTKKQNGTTGFDVAMNESDTYIR